ncbi:glycoside hydrolase family 6 protein [Streptomyces sp. NPDC049881]|uniref:glycoside hydrolase family 6 protein n=1 Tax=unclassified Streptomyces TaxID=2593676 RepID=UPI0034199D43
MLRRSSVTAVLCCAVLALACSSGGEAAHDGPREGGAAAGTADERFWVDPDSPAARQVAEWEAEGRTDDAGVLRRIADRPLAHWAPGEEDPGAWAREVTEAATARETTAVLVAYNIPHRDCGQYSQGGARDEAAYAGWIDALAEGIGDAHAVVVLEPDAVPHIVDGCTAPMYVEDRLATLGDAVDRLKRQPHTRVYLDAGNPAWIADPARIADPLRRAGVERADGFALNVANFQTLSDNTAYGRALSELLDGAHFVIDTSRNGNGPYDGGEESWCNPPGRALGTPPTADTGDALTDALLWIKRPGESDGECRGGPAAGEWWPEYALELARAAAP